VAEAFLTPLALLANIVKTAPDALVVVDREGRIMFANEETERVFGYPREELMGEPLGSLLRQDEESPASVPSTAEGRLQHVVAKGGRRVPVEVRTSSVPFEGGVLAAHSIRDVTEREPAEREGRRLREQLAHVGRVSALGELVSSVAHEINQPLAAILSNAQAAQRFLDRENPDLEEVGLALDDIVAADRRASEVISHLRSMVRRELRDAVLLDLGTLMGDLDPLLRRDASERAIEWTVDIAPDLPQVEGDSIQLQQVLLNLVLNAFDAVEQGERESRAVGVEMRGGDDGSVEVEVRDTGVGLEEGDEERVFEAFVTSKESGLGMGLSISRTVVETHGGRIWAERNDDGGATFRVSLPRAQ